MVNKCDICGAIIAPDARYCGDCGVDLREPKGSEQINNEKITSTPKKVKAKSLSKKTQTKDEDIIHWHSIRALCNSFEMTYPYFFHLVILFARGKKKLGFCDCSACNQGYREMLAQVVNVTEKKKLTAQSREIVIRAREEKVDGFTLDFSEFIRSMDENDTSEKPSVTNVSAQKQTGQGKIVIELDPEVIENAVFSVLQTEKGRELIQSIPRKRMKKSDSK